MTLYIFLGLIFAFTSIALCLFHVSIETKAGTFDFFNLKNLFLLYYLFLTAIYPFAWVISGSPILSQMGIDLLSERNQIYFLEANAFALVGLLAFFLGYGIGPRTAPPRGMRQSTASPPARARKGARLATLSLFTPRTMLVAVIAIQWVATYIFFSQFGGIIAFLASVDLWRSTASGKGYLIIFICHLPVIAYCYYLSIEGLKDRVRLSKSQILLFVLVLAPSIPLGFRVTWIPYVLQIMIIYHFMVRKLNFRKALAAGILIATVLGLYGGVRAVMNRSDKEMNATEALGSTLFRLPGTEVNMVVLRYFDENHAEHAGLSGLMEAFTILIPRDIWEGKPSPSMEVFAETVFRDLFFARSSDYSGAFGGVSPTVIGDFYWRTGYLGTILGMILLGLACKWSYAWFKRDEQGNLFLYALLCSSFWIFAESPQDALNGLVVKFSAALVLPMIVVQGTRRASRSARSRRGRTSVRAQNAIDTPVAFEDAFRP
jgi:oligosaccharide repeat unit polymerase